MQPRRQTPSVRLAVRIPDGELFRPRRARFQRGSGTGICGVKKEALIIAIATLRFFRLKEMDERDDDATS